MGACPPNGRGFCSDGSDAMEPPEIKTSDQQAGGAPLQYSLRTMFIVMTVVAVVLSGVFAGPGWFSLLTGLVLAVLAPMVLTVAIIYGRSHLRTFCIGALFPAGVVFIAVVPLLFDLTYFIAQRPRRIVGASGETGWFVGVSIVVAGAVIVVSGLVAVGVRWMVEAPQRREQREASLR
jgi:hypothetical protein